MEKTKLAFILIGFIASAISYFLFGPAIYQSILLLTCLIGSLPLFLKTALALYEGKFGVDVIALTAITSSLLFGQYFAGVVILLMLAGGEALEDYAVNRAKKELTHLLSNAPTTAHRKLGEEIVDVPVREVKVGEELVVKPGEVIPVDAKVQTGISPIDESMITGEPNPVEKGPGMTVLSGSINLSNPLTILVLAESEHSEYARIIRLVREAQAKKAPFVRLADRYSVVFTVVTFTLAFLSFAVTRDPIRFLAVLVVATPCPLILATPIAFVSGISRAASRGIIVKSGASLEKLAQAVCFVFDKTGTVTFGVPSVSEIKSYNRVERDEILQIAASLEQFSTHVLASSIVFQAKEDRLPLKYPANFREEVGLGVSGELEGRKYYFGKVSFLASKKVEIPPAIRSTEKDLAKRSVMAVYLALDSTILGAVVFSDLVRPQIKRVFETLTRNGVKQLCMVTGDKTEPAKNIAQQVGISCLRAEVLPEEKVTEIKKQKEEYGKVAMVGDGVNDAPALAASDVGIALGAKGSTATSEVGDIVIMVDDLQRVAEIYLIGKRVLSIAKQGIFLGMGVSLVMMGFAAFGFIPPLVGAVLQEGLDVVVILNSLRARFYRS